MLIVSDTPVPEWTPRRRRNIFEPFSRLGTRPRDRPRARDGLRFRETEVAICLVRATWGRVYIHNLFTTGRRSTPARHTNDGAAALAREGETILLVEDEESFAPLHVTNSGYGYTVLEASCGSEAIRIAGQHRGPPSCLTDVVMPE